MKFNRLTQSLLVFIGGWVMGWYSYHHWSGAGLAGYYRQLPPLTVTLVHDEESEQKALPAQAPEPSAVVVLLRGQRFDEVMDQYDELAAINDAQGMRRYRGEIFSYVEALLKGEDQGPAVALLTRYLQSEFTDVQGRLTLAELYQRQREAVLAIDTLYQAKTYAYQADTVTRINDRIRAAVVAHNAALEANRDYLGVLELFQRLTQLEPDYSPFFVGLARAQLALSDYSGARQSLTLVMHDPTVGREVEELLAMMEDRDGADHAEAGVAIPLQRIGNHFLVEGWIDNDYPIVLLIDTGASVTVIEPTTLASAGLAQDRVRRFARFKTANGEVEAPLLTLGGLSVGEFTVNDLEVGILELSSMEGVDGLLGMNYLQHFQFFIDQSNGLLRLSPTER